MDPLLYVGLTYHQRLALREMTQHPGYEIVRLLLEDASKKATEAVIKLDPEVENYETLLKVRQLSARITNDVCATLIKSITMHADAAAIEQDVQKAAKEAAANPESQVTPVGEKFGSFVLKPRKTDAA